MLSLPSAISNSPILTSTCISAHAEDMLGILCLQPERRGVGHVRMQCDYIRSLLMQPEP